MLLPLDSSGKHPQSTPAADGAGPPRARAALAALPGLPRATPPALVDARLDDLVEGIRRELARAGEDLDRLEALIRGRRS